MSTEIPFIAASCILLLSLASADGGQPVDIKVLCKEVNADIRAVEKMRDKDTAVAKIAEIRKKIDAIAKLDPGYFELRGLETKYKRLTGIYGAPAGTAAPAAKPAPDPGRSASSPEREQALKDWQEISQLRRGFLKDVETVIPSYVKNVIYSDSDIDEVIAKIRSFQAQAPGVKARLEAFRKKYGSDPDEIDRKMEDLKPGNQRPPDSAGRCFSELSNGLTNLEEAPKIEAKKILAGVLSSLDRIENFIADTERDRRYQELEASIQKGLKFNPQDAELKEWALKIKTLRQKSQADIEKSLDAARFPGHMTGFAGPGGVDELAASCVKYFNESDPSQTTVKVSIAGNWVVAKENIFGEPVQWGLPIWAVGYKNDNREIARVFKLTILTGEALGISKSPPWTGQWVGDSYRMRTANIK
ncbi:hypothetical protein JW906_13885 [bacterium]|nr:hypothetical protein [bacterium]